MMKGFFQRLLRSLDLVAQPRYPEYEEYRDEDPDESLGRARSLESPPGDQNLSPEAQKLARLRLLTVAILFFGSLMLGYFWFVREAPTGRPGQPSPDMLRQALETEMRRDGIDATGGSAEGNSSLEDIKRWAAEMDERVRREAGVADTSARNLPSYYGQERTWTDTYVLSPVEVILPVRAETVTAPPSPAPPASSIPASSPPPATAPTSPPVSVPPVGISTSTETRGGYYRRRELSPVTIDPVNVEPY